jgi:DNA polymerase alpha subunit A
MQRYDPDVIIGHGFIDNHFDVIMQRLKEQKIEHWSRIGRFRRSKPPIIGRQGTNVKYLAGRLVCDLTSDSAKVPLTISFSR